MRKIAFFIIFVFLAIQSFATHNRAGEITYEQLSELTYKFTLVTYTYTPSLADRPTLVLEWGDGTESTVNRISKISLPNQVNMNIYTGTHTYSGQGSFVISMLDQNRNGGVTNIPNSINQPFYMLNNVVLIFILVKEEIFFSRIVFPYVLNCLVRVAWFVFNFLKVLNNL